MASRARAFREEHIVTRYRYSPPSLRTEALRAGIGIAVMILVWIAAGSGFFAWASAALILLFAAYGLSIALKALTSVLIDTQGVSLQRAVPFPPARRLVWNDIRQLRLDFFPERRDRAQGWFRLVIIGPSARISIDSSLENFSSFVGEILAATAVNDVALSPATRHNLKALKLAPGGATLH